MVKTFSGSGPVLFRVDADPRRGLKRLEQCDTLASALASWGFGPIHFVVDEQDPAVRWAEHSRYRFSRAPAEDRENEVAHIRDVQERLSPAVQVVFTTANSPDFLQQIDRPNVTLVSLWDRAAKPNLQQGVVVNLSLASRRRLEPGDLRPHLHVGPKYALLNPAYQILSRKRAEGKLSKDPRNRVLVLSRGSESLPVTIALLHHLVDGGMAGATTLLIEETEKGHEELNKMAAGEEDAVRILSGFNPQDTAALLASCDLAVNINGKMAYELTCLGVPALHVSVTAEDAEEAAAFESCGVAVHVNGRRETASAEAWEVLCDLLNDRSRGEGMGRKARELVDGQGADRVARVIAEACETQSL